MPVVEIYGCAVIEHSKYKGATIYKGEDNRWFAEYSDSIGWVRTIENSSLQDLKIDINNKVATGTILPDEKTYRMARWVNSVDEGETVHIAAGSYEPGICDVCGMKRKVDWVEVWPARTRGFDCCRSCRKEVLQVVE